MKKPHEEMIELARQVWIKIFYTDCSCYAEDDFAGRGVCPEHRIWRLAEQLEKHKNNN